MSGLYEDDVLKEMKYGNDFAYFIKDETVFLPTEYKILQNQTDGLFIKCMKLRYNGKIQIYYLTSSFRSLKNMMEFIDAENTIVMIKNLLEDIIKVKRNGFLSCQNIDSSAEHIFVDPATYKISLVYVPIRRSAFRDVHAFENELRTTLVKILQNTPMTSSRKSKQLESDLMNGMFSVEDLYTKLTAASDETSQQNRGNGRVGFYNTKLKLIAVNSPVLFEISITKDEFVLGKKQELVDGVIPFNKMISRTHCKIIRQGDRYAVADLKSANGTYLNGIRLQAEHFSPIKNGDVIRLANSDFRVVIE